jgi:hypothetical protein
VRLNPDPFQEVRPRYGEASLADLLPGVLAVLGVPGVPDVLDLRAPLAGVRRIAVLLVDGLGAYQVHQATPDAPLLAELAAAPDWTANGGSVTPGTAAGARTLTAAFPSTTPVSLVTLSTGVPPGVHGIVGFAVRTPAGTVLNHLRWRDDPDPARWQPVPTRWSQATAAGVATVVVSRPEYRGTGLNEAANRGGDYRPASSPDEVVDTMLAALRDAPAPALVSGYHPDVDKAGHEHGVGSPRWRAAVAGTDRLVTRLVEGLPPDAALLVTADHGQFDVPAGARFDISTDPRLTAGVTVVAGEPRVRYLHTAPGAAADVLATWRGVLGPAATVVTREEAVAQGWFGPVTAEHAARIGDVVAICRGRHVVLHTGVEPPSVTAMVAFHGAASAVELTVPLLVARSVAGSG